MILENVQSHKNLENISITILMWFSEYIANNVNKLDILNIFSEYFSDVDGKALQYLNSTDVDVDFLEKINSKNLLIKFVNTENDKKDGVKAKIVEHIITIYINNTLRNKLKENINNGNPRENLRLLTTEKVFSNLLHELTHYYDWIRGNKLKHNSKSETMVKLISSKKFDELKKNNPKLYRELVINYLNLPHEINARFSQAVLDSGISSIEDEEKLTNKEINFFIDEFISTFYGWDVLEDKYKKRIYSRVYQFLNK